MCSLFTDRNTWSKNRQLSKKNYITIKWFDFYFKVSFTPLKFQDIFNCLTGHQWFQKTPRWLFYPAIKVLLRKLSTKLEWRTNNASVIPEGPFQYHEYKVTSGTVFWSSPRLNNLIRTMMKFEGLKPKDSQSQNY